MPATHNWTRSTEALKHSINNEMISASVAFALIYFLRVGVEGFVPFRSSPATQHATPSRLPSAISDTRSNTDTNGSTQTKSDEELLAERLAAPSNSIGQQFSWLMQPNGPTAKEEKPWFVQLGSSESSDASLPFECTGCGKCCKTKGDVYLSPSETKGAAALLRLTILQFKQKYVAEEEVTVTMSLDSEEIREGETGWTVLRHKEEDGACVFLDEEGLCSIYEARPLQCSTYPFWPRIMASRASWNDEVRLEGDAPKEEENAAQHKEIAEKLYWSVEEGGCEGMHKIEVDGTSTSDVDGILSSEAEDRLAMYDRYRKRFPNTELRSIRNQNRLNNMY